MLKTLKAATSYQFRVSAVNKVGEGTPSEPSNTVSLPHEGELNVNSKKKPIRNTISSL